MVEVILHTNSVHLEFRIDASMIWAMLQMLVYVIGGISSSG